MSAHMYVTMLRIPDDHEPGRESVMEAFRAALAATSDRDKIIAATSPHLVMDWPAGLNLPFDPAFGADDDLTAAEIDALAADDAVMEFINARLDAAVDQACTREVATYRLFGCHVAVTGGMSHGDHPTDAFEAVELLGAIPALRVPEDAPDAAAPVA